MNLLERRLVRLPRALAGALLLTILCCALTPPVAAGEPARDVEPAPPWVFFPEPDEVTAREIDKVVQGFADLNKAGPARDLLVRRFGLWSAPKLRRVLAAEGDEARHVSLTWNAALTAYVLRDQHGNARELWPLVGPLVDLLATGAGPWRRAFAALGLGSFHCPAFAPAPPPAERRDPYVVRPPEVEYRRDLERAVDALAVRVDDDNVQVRVAVAFALAKSGTPTARERLRAAHRLEPDGDFGDKNPSGRQAVLLAVGFLPDRGDEDLLFRALADSDARMRQAGALAVALQALNENPPPWTRSPHRLYRALRAPRMKLQHGDGEEAVFARGVLVAQQLVRQSEWRDLFDLATKPLGEKGAIRAAAQVLLFCGVPWFLDRARERVKGGTELDPVALATFLLLLGSSPTPEDLSLLSMWLSNRGRSPRADPAWDVRFYAVIGLLRALASASMNDAELRARIVTMLEGAVKRGLDKGPFRDALSYFLSRETRRILEQEEYVVSEERVLAVEKSFRDVHGLLARDLRDVAVVRLNRLVPKLFTVQDLRPGTPGDRSRSHVPQRFLETCLDRYPYFTRLDLRADRGRRPPAVLWGADDPQEMVDR